MANGTYKNILEERNAQMIEQMRDKQEVGWSNPAYLPFDFEWCLRTGSIGRRHRRCKKTSGEICTIYYERIPGNKGNGRTDRISVS